MTNQKIKINRDVQEFIDYVGDRLKDMMSITPMAIASKGDIISIIERYEITSPIEQLFLAAVWLEASYQQKSQSVMISPQFKECGYVADLLLVVGGKMVLVELDGFNYHDSTMESATRDKKRDRELMRNGWMVVRFSGQEITRNPLMRAREAIDICAKHGKEPGKCG